MHRLKTNARTQFLTHTQGVQFITLKANNLCDQQAYNMTENAEMKSTRYLAFSFALFASKKKCWMNIGVHTEYIRFNVRGYLYVYICMWFRKGSYQGSKSLDSSELWASSVLDDIKWLK